MVACPLFHVAGGGFATIAMVLGGTLVLLPRFSPQAFCRTVEEQRVTATVVVPTMLHELCEWGGARRHDLSSLRAVVCTGSPLERRLCRRASRLLGDVIYDLYGSSETGWVSVATPGDLRDRPGSVGRPLPHVRVRILDHAGQPVSPGTPGEIWVSSAMAMNRYEDDARARGEGPGRRSLSVRDLGFLDEDGYLHVVDRADDMIITGGVNVYPAEVEAALRAHPRVIDAVAFGLPDAKWGRRVVADVVCTGPISERSLTRWCKARLVPAAVPKEVHFVRRISRTPLGKVDRQAALRDGPKTVTVSGRTGRMALAVSAPGEGA
jgi:long-chain acyl-CoA synthetase